MAMAESRRCIFGSNKVDGNRGCPSTILVCILGAYVPCVNRGTLNVCCNFVRLDFVYAEIRDKN